jgi:hypothetical protein
MNQQTANFFWHGQPFSLYEKACVSSFLKCGFDVNVWVFDFLDVPNGANLKNASEFFKISEINNFTQDNVKGSLAAFSDAIRYHILNQYGGWWFDTDCFCLKNEKDFELLSKNKRIIAGWEDDKNINGAVLSFPDKSIAKESLELFEDICKKQNYIFNWGDIGPKLITSLVDITNTHRDILSTDYFYPIHYKETLTFFEPSLTNDISKKVENSFVVHLWNEIIRKNKINKNIMPEKNSFLYKKFVEVL